MTQKNRGQRGNADPHREYHAKGVSSINTLDTEEAAKAEKVAATARHLQRGGRLTEGDLPHAGAGRAMAFALQNPGRRAFIDRPPPAHFTPAGEALAAAFLQMRGGRRHG